MSLRYWYLLVTLGTAFPLAACRPHCSASSETRDAGCVDTWVCGADVFQVRCEAQDGGRQCVCVKNGMTEAPAQPEPWCRQGTPDTYERIVDANRQCGWSMWFEG